MAREQDNRTEIPQTNAATEASKRFLGRRIFWKTAETLWDAGRLATLPLRLAGNIVKDTFKLGDDLDSTSQMGMVFYEFLFGMTTGPLALAGGIAILTSNPVGWAIAGGIGLTALGLAAESINIGGIAVGIGHGVADTYNHAKEKRQYLKGKRAERRARWR